MKEEYETNSLLSGFGSCKAGVLLLDRRSVDATPSEVIDSNEKTALLIKYIFVSLQKKDEYELSKMFV
jgi:hypothetical protein